MVDHLTWVLVTLPEPVGSMACMKRFGKPQVMKMYSPL